MKKVKLLTKYRITCPVESVEGWQTWIVEADNLEEALAKHKQGESEFEDEELNVMELGTPEITEATDL